MDKSADRFLLMQFRPTGWIGTIRVSGPRRRFNPAEVTRQYAELCKQYRITVKDVQASAGALGMSVDIVYASTESEPTRRLQRSRKTTPMHY